MTLNDAYRKGQEDMRRRIEERFRIYSMSDMSAQWRANKGKKSGDVPIEIRRMKVRDLPADARGFDGETWA